MNSEEEILSVIKIGMTREEVLAILGEPDGKNIGTRKYPFPTIWAYGELEFRFEYEKEGKLDMIYAKTKDRQAVRIMIK